ncbi:DUF4890 domain-containing protein [Spirosoma sp. BT702]|uniref:DUF4890 domain-containing protein n=1 Tax=Spirosoma profusum TaxID=2771354 RepID=A0A927ATT3_9BACT|nr:DUF4890 domain-containing protein [Spirosoma profusum]MBD2701037.1 DUF4890 domain-containing protein [Spirosoma profusum]
MLKKLIVGGFLFSLFSLPLFTQQATAQDVPAQNRAERRGRTMQDVDPATRAQRMTDRMTKQLSLDEATSKKVYDLVLARAEKMDAIQKNSDDRKTKMQAMKAGTEAFQADLKKVLTAEQFAKFESMRDQMGRRRGGLNREKADDNGSK